MVRGASDGKIQPEAHDDELAWTEEDSSLIDHRTMKFDQSTTKHESVSLSLTGARSIVRVAAASSSNAAPSQVLRYAALLLVAVTTCAAAVGLMLIAFQSKDAVASNATDTPPPNSTVDALVTGHVTSVSSRVPGQVRRVLVNENARVDKGDVLIELDKEPFEIQVAAKQAGVSVAEADLLVAQAQVRALVAQIRASRYKLEQAMEDVKSQIAKLEANVAGLESKKAALQLTQAELRRGEEAAAAISAREIAKRREAAQIAQVAVDQALHEVNVTRAGLGLPVGTANSTNLREVPADHDQTDSSVRQSLLELVQSLALLGYAPTSWKGTPKQVIDDFYKQDVDGDVDRIYAQLITRAPGIKQAEAKLRQANLDLDQAQLTLRDCSVVSAIDGMVISREVNAGNNVAPGQNLMTLSSLTELWITAEVRGKERQSLPMGRPVRCKVDALGGQHEVEGHIAGFSGATRAAQKLHNSPLESSDSSMRLIVRIDLDNYEAGTDPIFVGLPAVVHIEPVAVPAP
jgi:membrane fusion protein (multidrug efflux system)